MSAATEYRPAIDGLRAIAVLAVFFFHLDRAWLPGGFAGVDVFFVISGYLITSILQRDYERHQDLSFGRFYQRRIARLFPAFFTAALLTLAGAALIYSEQDLASAGINLAAVSLSVANLKFMLQGNYFTLSPDAQPYLHYWSLSVEEQFYLIFPALLLLLYRRAGRHRLAALGVLCAISLIACIAVTYTRPTWAFYLLPTRAWELLVGAVLAVISTGGRASSPSRTLVPVAGLVFILASFVVLSEGPGFPGYLALLPVVGTAAVVGVSQGSGFVERMLSWPLLVRIGRMSYSLYLFHWPVFSLVDYRLYLAPAWVRLSLKVVITVALTTVCFRFIENPGRIYLNDPRRRRVAFAFLAVALLVVVPLGIAVRRANYFNADPGAVAGGGLSFNASGTRGSLVLMGDSNGSMYGRMARDIARERDLRLRIISVADGDPLPGGPLWRDSLAVVERERPDAVLLVCEWLQKLDERGDRLPEAVRELRRYARLVVLITEPPQLPPTATRDEMRRGTRPPFVEESDIRDRRVHRNAIVRAQRGDGVAVVDIERLFVDDQGAIRLTDASGTELFQDRKHLSAAGAALVKPAVVSAMIR